MAKKMTIGKAQALIEVGGTRKPLYWWKFEAVKRGSLVGLIKELEDAGKVSYVGEATK